MSQGTGKGERRERRKEIREGKSSVRGSQQRRKRGHKGRGKDGGRGGREREGVMYRQSSHSVKRHSLR